MEGRSLPPVVAGPPRQGRRRQVAGGIRTALAADPGNKDLLAGLTYHAQETLAHLHKAKGSSAAVAPFESLRNEFPQGDGVAGVVAARAERAVDALAGVKKWEEAVRKCAEGRKAYPKNDRLVNNAVVTVDDWARTAMDKGDWAEAIRVYDVGRAHFPGDGHITRMPRTTNLI